MPLAKTAPKPTTPVQQMKEFVESGSRTVVMGSEEKLPVPKRFYEYFGIDSTEGRILDKAVDKQLKEIFEYASKRSKDKNLSGVIVFIDRIAKKLGDCGSQRLYNKVYNYIKLSRDIASMEQEKRMYER